MSIAVPLHLLKDDSLREKIADDLTVIQLDETYESMKKQGRILPGYTPNPDKKIYVFDITDDDILHVPYNYGRNILDLKNNDLLYPKLGENVKNKSCLWPNQLETSDICYKQLLDVGCTTVGLPPGYGKTYIGAHLSFLLGLKVIVIVPREPLLKQWSLTFKNSMPNATQWIVKDAKHPSEMPDIIIALDPRISKIPKTWKNMYGTLIIDEAHMIPTRSRIQNLLSIKPEFVIMETATMVRTDDLHKICHLIGGTKGVFKTSSDPFLFEIVDLPFIKGEEKTGHMGIDYTHLCSSLSETDEYNRVILNIVKQHPCNKFIILTRRVEHGKLLVKMFRDNDITADSMMGTKKSYQNSRVLIGTFSKIGTGFDEKTSSHEVFEGEVSDSLIVCHSIKKDANAAQFFGRVMRTKNPTIYWLNVGNGVIKNHLRLIKKYVKTVGGTINSVDGKRYLYSKNPLNDASN